jgi:outer membrane cobalamin receptor
MVKLTSFLFVLIVHILVSNSFGQLVDSVYQLPKVHLNSSRKIQNTQAGSKETHIDTLVLQQKNTASLSELLSENTPIFIKSHGRGALATASFRGTSPSHTQVNWNGININSPMVGMVDFSLIPVYLIDELNLKHGPASVIDRSGGLGGSVSITNKPNWDTTFRAKYLQGIGSYKTFDEFLQLSFGNNSWQSKTRVYHNYSKNDYTFTNRSIGHIDPKSGTITNPLDINKNASYKRYGLLQELYYRHTGGYIFSLKYWGQFAERAIPRATSYEGPDNTNTNNQTDLDHKVIADWRKIYQQSELYIKSAFAHKDLLYEQHNRINGLGVIPAVYSTSKQNSYLNGITYALQKQRNLNLKASLDFNHHSVNSRDSVQHTSFTQDRTEVSALISSEKKIKELLKLNLMLRQDIIDGKLSPTIPYAGFSLALNPKQTLLVKGNIARNFHQPTLSDLYWQPGGNSDLQPEKGLSSELGVLSFFNIKKQAFEIEVTAYRSDIKNWIIWLPSFKGYWEPLNIERVLSRGLETNLNTKGKLGKLRYHFAASYAYTSSLNYGDQYTWGRNSYKKQLVYIPLHSGNIFAGIEYKGFSISWQHNYYSERYTTSSNEITRRDWLYPYFMNDLSLGKTLKFSKMQFSTTFKVYNILNESYHSILYRPMPKRNYMFIFVINY